MRGVVWQAASVWRDLLLLSIPCCFKSKSHLFSKSSKPHKAQTREWTSADKKAGMVLGKERSSLFCVCIYVEVG